MGFGRMGGGGGGGNMGKMLMKQMEDMQRKAERIQEELAEKRIQGSAGGGMVVATADGQGKLLEVIIKPEVVDPDDVEMLQDLVLAAVSEAITSAQAIREESMGALTGGMKLPGGLGGLI
ncbi:MAG: YbaB/EbfC family nucleoid-associated protein [bacterium]